MVGMDLHALVILEQYYQTLTPLTEREILDHDYYKYFVVKGRLKQKCQM